MKLLSFGAGPWQAEGIKRAHSSGVHVIAVDTSGLTPGFDFADECLTSLDSLPEVPSISFATDFGVPSASVDKLHQKRKFFEHGLKTPRLVTTGKRVEKPRIGSGSRGVVILDSSASKLGSCIAEEYIHGTEYSVETFSVYGRAYPLLTLRKRKRTDTVADMLVTEVDKHKESRIAIFACRMVDAMGVQHGPSHSEVIMTPDGTIYAIETSPRGGGFHVWQSLITISTGFDAVGWTIKAALGFYPWPDFPKKCFEAGIRFYTPGETVPPSGTDGAVTEVFDWYPRGYKPKNLTDSDRVGCAIMRGTLGQDLEARFVDAERSSGDSRILRH